jgi:hypothetical protein
MNPVLNFLKMKNVPKFTNAIIKQLIFYTLCNQENWDKFVLPDYSNGKTKFFFKKLKKQKYKRRVYSQKSKKIKTRVFQSIIFINSFKFEKFPLFRSNQTIENCLTTNQRWMAYESTECDVMSGHVMSCHVMSCQVMSCHLMSYFKQI